jgi:4-amino-4-deoxy-L-arabinose transferase-like glycosyltransferase
LWHYYPGFLPWARDAIAVVGAVALVVLVAARLSRRLKVRLVTVALAAGVAAVIAAPGAWAASVLDTAYGGSSFNASAGPVGGAGGGGGITSSATTTLTTAEQRVYNYVSAHRGGASYLMAVGSWAEAGQYILATGQEVMDLGGFSGSVPSPTLVQVKKLVSTGQLRYFLVSGAGSGAGGGSTATAIDSWVTSACAQVPAKDYSTSATAKPAGGETGTLYVCSPSA